MEIFMCFFILIGVIFGVGGTILWIWMLIDCAVNESPEGNEKVVWIIIIALTHTLGALIYLIVRRPQRKATLGR